MYSETPPKQALNNLSNLSINITPSPTSSVNTNTTSSSHISSTASSKSSSSSTTNSTNSTNSTQSTQSSSPSTTTRSSESCNSSSNNCADIIVMKKRRERRRRLSDPQCLPLLYEVYCQARIRSGYSLTSTHLTDLPVGSVVTVEEIKPNHRARISAPIHGWCSIISKHGKQLLQPLNKQTAKIGGKVLFSKHYSRKYANHNITAKIVDYNPNYDMHKVRYKDGKEEWINLKNRHIRYIPQNV